MSIKTAYSRKPVAEEAAHELWEALGTTDPKLLLYFASSQYPFDEIAAEMQAAFSGVKTVGCTTSGEIVTGKMLKESVVAMAFTEEVIADFSVQIVKNLKGEFDLKPAFDGFTEHFGTPVRDLDIHAYVGLVFEDGMSGAEERLLDAIGNKTDVIFIGGSAGDDLKFEKTAIFYEGKAYEDAALLLLMKPNVDFGFIKTQSFRSLGKALTASKVDEAARIVHEFDGKPAVIAYAEALAVPTEQAKDYFFENPIALQSGEELYIRSPKSLAEDQSISFYCNVKEGSHVTLVENTDIIKDTAAAILEKQKEMGNITGLLVFNCILRTLELESKNLIPEFEKILEEIPLVGFSTYGESFIGHINQTATILAFGKKK